jgi:SRSO17 transposase
VDARHARVADRFGRGEPRRRVPAYLRGLPGPVGRKNGWQLAGHASERTPMGAAVVATADWDPDLVRDDLRAGVSSTWATLAGCWWPTRPGFLEKGTTSVGVQRRYSGTAGKVDNCQLGAFWPMPAPRGGRSSTGAGPARSWTEDPARSRVPEEVGFQTKPQLARVMLERALAAGVPASWVTADEADGGDPALRRLLEDRSMSYCWPSRAPSRWRRPPRDR